MAHTLYQPLGMALYHDLAPPPSNQVTAKAKIWSYPTPTGGFQQIKDYLCFYASSGTDHQKVGNWICVSVVGWAVEAYREKCVALTGVVCLLTSFRWSTMIKLKRRKVTFVSKGGRVYAGLFRNFILIFYPLFRRLLDNSRNHWWTARLQRGSWHMGMVVIRQHI